MHCLNRHELPSDKALLRLRHYYDTAPEANAGNAAMHLANFALHAVATRSARLQDPRMRSLRSVGHLQVRPRGGAPAWDVEPDTDRDMEWSVIRRACECGCTPAATWPGSLLESAAHAACWEIQWHDAG